MNIIFGGCLGIILACLGIEYFYTMKKWRQEKQDKKNLFIKRLSGRKDYEVIETVLNGKKVYVERRIK